MRSVFAFAAPILLSAACIAGSPPRSGGVDGLRASFANPPPEARLQAWWHWHGDNIAEEELLRDLDAMRDFGVGTVHIFCAYSTYEIEKLWKRMLTDEWLRVFRRVLARAKENGMSLGVHNCPGWSSSGGPWIPVEKSMKTLVLAERDLRRGETGTVNLPLPRAVFKGFYRDVALVATTAADDPVPVRATGSFDADWQAFAEGRGEVSLPIAAEGSSASITFEFAAPTPRFATLDMDFGDTIFRTPLKVEASKDGIEWKTISDTRLHFYRTTLTTKSVALAPPPDGARFYRTSFAYVDAPPHILHIDLRLLKMKFSSAKDASDARDVTIALGEDGSADLAKAALPEPPEGRHWRLLRFGYTSTGAFNKPATVSGLECDKLDRSGIEAHWPNMPGLLKSLPEAKETLRYCIIDSYEAGDQNWTDHMPERFRSMRGYDLVPFLPALFGYSLRGGVESRFLGDFRRTVSDLFRTEYYGRFAELCRESGYVSIVEGYDGPYDPMDVMMTPDIPAGEFWLDGSEAGNANVDETPTWASSAAHLAGKSLVAAESFTTDAKPGRWLATPALLRRAGDKAWLNGISQIVYHSYVAQIFGNVRPGFSLSHHGTQLNRHTTWWPEGRSWSDYVARGQALLQAGRSHSEFLVLSGEGNPYSCRKHPADIVSAGFNFDWIPSSLVERLSVLPDGRIAFPGLPPYEALLVGEDRSLSLATVMKMHSLQLKGAKIVGRRPLSSPTMNDDDSAWNHYVNELFPTIPRDWRALGLRPFADSGGRLLARRRDLDDAVVYFLLNDSDAAFDGEVSVSAPDGAAVELWNAVDGSMEPISASPDGVGRTAFRITVPAHRSVFAVASRGCMRPSGGKAPRKWRATDISSGWTASFSGVNAPEGDIDFPELVSWTESGDSKMKYFSGRARYRRDVEVEGGGAVRLDLGKVHELANVFVNGKRVATLWEEPFEVDITEFARKGRNVVEVEVVNIWPNRLIGDAIFRRDHPGCEKMGDPREWHAWAAHNVVPPKGNEFPQWVLDNRPDSGTGVWTWSNFGWAWSPDDELLPSGLLGPVRIMEERVQ